MKANPFVLKSEYKPAGDQGRAIDELARGLLRGESDLTLLGVTGSGKTFTIANVIEKVQKPTLVIAHNKTLAAQLAQEYKTFFPNNAVHYFVSYYDFYQPEAYMPITDTYIEKEAMINEEIERLRHASTEALLSRNDCIIVASVSCIYGLGNPAEYQAVLLRLGRGQVLHRKGFLRSLVDIHYSRTSADLAPGTFRSTGNIIEILPISEKQIYRIELQVATDGEIVDGISILDPISMQTRETLEYCTFFPRKHFIAGKGAIDRAQKSIGAELDHQLQAFEKQGQILEEERLRRRTKQDLAMIREVGYCSGIENYSRHFDGRAQGEAPYTLLSYFPKDFLTVIDESHVTVSQIGAMYEGDRSRKGVLIEHGFRLPSAKDNRPLTFDEFRERVGRVIYTSATPGKYELEHSAVVARQVIRPTGLLDPVVEVRPILQRDNYPGQIHDFIAEAEVEIGKGHRVIGTTLTKRMAEDLSTFIKDKKLKAEYLHSDIKTIDRIEIISNFRRGEFDILIGVNLLREGLDMPEVTLIGILDADKEGFLRSETSLIQIIGRAARNVDGRVILYAERITGSIASAMEETAQRRTIQIQYNARHGIVPRTIEKEIKDIAEHLVSDHRKAVDTLLSIDTKGLKNLDKLIKQKEKQMNGAVKVLDFETAAIIRDEIRELEKRRDPASG